MSRLSQRARDLIYLIERSPDVGRGWRSVSDALLPAMPVWKQVAPELFELDPKNKRIRLTKEGRTVAKWL